MGHELRLIPPSSIKTYVKRRKSDALDAKAICKAVQRPKMRFVPVMANEQQGNLMTHRARSPLVRQRTTLANALVAHLAELTEQVMADRNALPSYARLAGGDIDLPDQGRERRDYGTESAPCELEYPE